MSNDEPFLQDLLPYLLQRASFVVTRRFHQHLRLYNVSASRWRLLAWLSEHQPCSINQLTEQLMLRQPSVSNLVDKSVEDGLVVKVPSAVDARRLEIRLSAAGAELVDDLKKQARLAEAEFVSRLGDEKAGEIKERLRELIQFAESDYV